MKQEEVQRISEAVGLCEKRAISKSSGAASAPSQSEVAADAAALEPPESNGKQRPAAAIKGRGHSESSALDA